MKKHFKIEGIPRIPSRIYSALVTKSPFIKDFYKEAAGEICSRVLSGRILDVGTGPGHLPFEIAKRSENLKVVGVDISPEMIRIAEREAAGTAFSDRVSFQVANASKLPFENNSFELAVSTLSFHHWLEPEKGLKEICRVFKDGGEAWIYELRRDTSEEGKKELQRRYGRLLSFILLHFVRVHSAITLKSAEEIISSPDIGFSRKSVEERGVVLKLKLLK